MKGLFVKFSEVKDGKVLIWQGGEAEASALDNSSRLAQAPVRYTPQHLAERILAEQAAMESRGSANGERKTITALFADLKGSTALIEGLDPEERPGRLSTRRCN